MPASVDISAGLVPIAPAKVDLTGGLVKPAPGQDKGFLGSFADSSGLSALAHPIDTIMGIPAGLKQMAADSIGNVKQGVRDYGQQGLSQDTRRDFGRAVPIFGPALAQAQAQHDAGNNAGMAGTLAGTTAGFAAPEALGAAKAAILPKMGGVAEAVGDAAQSQAGKIVNRATGTLKSDFKRGANPGRGYLAQGGGMATSMADLADKAEAVKNATADRLRSAYQAADASGVQIPLNDGLEAIAAPLKQMYGKLDKGGAPSSMQAALQDHASSFQKPIEQAIERGYFKPTELWDIKKNVADFTNWGDQAQKTINGVKQQQVGAMGGLLEKHVPELADLNQGYSDLVKMAGRARERANTGSLPLTSHMRDIGTMGIGAMFGGHEAGGLGALAGGAAFKVARSVPVRTGVAEGLYKAGGALKSSAQTLGNVADEGNQAIGNQVVNQGANLALGKGTTSWQNLGATKLLTHGMDAQAVDALRATPFGKRLLINASAMKVGSRAMKGLAASAIAQIAAQNGQKDDQ